MLSEALLLRAELRALPTVYADRIRNGISALGFCTLHRAPLAFIPDEQRHHVLLVSRVEYETTLARFLPKQLSLSEVSNAIP